MKGYPSNSIEAMLQEAMSYIANTSNGVIARDEGTLRSLFPRKFEYYRIITVYENHSSYVEYFLKNDEGYKKAKFVVNCNIDCDNVAYVVIELRSSETSSIPKNLIDIKFIEGKCYEEYVNTLNEF